MMRNRGIAAQFTNVGAGLTATANLPVNRRYHSLFISITDDTLAETQANMETLITQIRLMVDGKEQRVFSGAELFDMNLVYGQGVPVNGVIPIFFSEPHRRSADEENFGAWMMFPAARVFQIEVDLAGAADNPTLKLHALWDDGINRATGKLFPLGVIKHVTRQVVQVGASGLVTVDGLPLNGDYSSIFCFEGADNDITRVRLLEGDREVYDFTAALMEDNVVRRGGTLASGVFALRFDETGRLNDTYSTTIRDKAGRVVGQKPTRLEFTLGNANNFTMLSEVWAPLV